MCLLSWVPQWDLFYYIELWGWLFIYCMLQPQSVLFLIMSQDKYSFLQKQKVALKCHYICPLRCLYGQHIQNQADSSHWLVRNMCMKHQSLLHPSRTDGFYHHSPHGPWSSAEGRGWSLGFHTEERQIHPHNGNQSAEVSSKLVWKI